MADNEREAFPLSRPNPPLGGNAALQFTPYILPLSQDHRLDPLTPDAWKRDPLRCPRRYRLWRRLWGREFQWPRPDIDFARALDELNTRTAPASDAERIEWFEPVNFRGIRLGATPLAWELARVAIEPIGTGVLERVVTYLRAQALDAAGNPVGAPFITNVLTDPASLPITHPTAGVGALNVQWHLVAVGYSVKDDDFEPLVTAAPPSSIPTAAEPLYGLPLRWADLRYPWGGEYTRFRHVVVAGPVQLRLFGIFSSASPDRWRVVAGGSLAGYWQSAGPMGHARRAAATTRW